MSEIGFQIIPARRLSAAELQSLRNHYLVYDKAERDEHRSLRRDLDEIYGRIDALVEGGAMLRTVSALNECDHIVVFATESSILALREFQQAMLAEGKAVRLVPEVGGDINSIHALPENDLLIVVTTSNGFARRQRTRIEASRAFKVIVTASEDRELHSVFDDVLTIGEGSDEGSSLHRIYATFGVTYFFDRLFAQYARAFDPELKQE
jgi:DNA-binding MurR/RpiR family transcriptional regulator